MSKQESILRHQIIIKRLRLRPATFKEISDRLTSESALNDMDLEVSKRTFQRDLKEIQTLYGTEIKYNRSQGAYEIVEEDKDEFHERMFEAMDIFQALRLGQSFESIIEFDTRKALGSEHLSGLLFAIQNRFQIKFRYEKFRSDEVAFRTVEPYLLKEFKRRWYIFAFDLDRKDFRIFGLDRMDALQITNIKFQHPQKIKPKRYFENSFGMISGNTDQVKEIELEFINSQGDYIRSLPLHRSQKILYDKDGVMRVSLKILPTYDFIQEILSQGKNVKVLKPESLVKEVKKVLENTLNLYK